MKKKLFVVLLVFTIGIFWHVPANAAIGGWMSSHARDLGAFRSIWGGVGIFTLVLLPRIMEKITGFPYCPNPLLRTKK